MGQTRMTHSKKLVVALVVLATVFGIVNIFLVPPFMNPDEIQHFMFSANYAYDETQLKQLDKDVLQLLKDHKWFHFIGVGPGWESIKKIRDIYFLKYFSRARHSVSKTYFHFIYGSILKLSGIQNPLTAFYFLRFISFLFFLGIFLLSLFFYKKNFPRFWAWLAAGQLLLCQPAMILNSINYDVLLTLLGVLFFMAAYRYMERGDQKLLIFLVVVSLLSLLIKKGGLLFFVYLFLLILFKTKISPKFIKSFLLVVIFTVVLFSWFNYLFPGLFFTIYTIIFAKMRIISTLSVSDGGLVSAGFFDSVLDSFFYYSGWMGFKIAGIWYVVIKILFLAAALMTFAMTFFKKLTNLVFAGEESAASVLAKKWHLYAMIVFLLQLLSVWLYYGSGTMAQGRYLYPVMIPVVTVLFYGLACIGRAVGLRAHYIHMALVVFLLLFLLAGLLQTVSVFYLEIASPHAGL